jgi:CAAX protease family protein
MTQPDDVVRKARVGLLFYFVALCAGSVPIEWMIIRHGLSIGSILALMWVPAIASAIVRAILREGVSDISFRLPLSRTRWVLLGAWLFPVAVGAVAYGVGWMAGLGRFAPPTMGDLGAHFGSPYWRFATLLASSLVVNVSIGMIFTAGEEIGWRGYMLTRLIAAGVPKPIFMSGLIWGLWHIPLILSGRYVTSSGPLVSAALFMVTILAGGYLIAWLRLATGSVWPAILFHASWNTVIQDVFDRSTSGRSIWLGESGLLVVIVCVILVICVAPLFRGAVTHAIERISAGRDS